jgi:hypothetical protein
MPARRGEFTTRCSADFFFKKKKTSASGSISYFFFLASQYLQHALRVTKEQARKLRCVKKNIKKKIGSSLTRCVPRVSELAHKLRCGARRVRHFTTAYYY